MKLSEVKKDGLFLYKGMFLNLQDIFRKIYQGDKISSLELVKQDESLTKATAIFFGFGDDPSKVGALPLTNINKETVEVDVIKQHLKPTDKDEDEFIVVIE
ncbi:MAG: hypothetical protein AB9836_04630 [Aminipila sp.]